MEKPKILIIENSTHITGALKSIGHAARSIGGQFDFTFIVPRHTHAIPFLEKMGFKSIGEMRLTELSRNVKSLVVYIPRLVVNAYHLHIFTKRNNISLIHVNDIYNLLPVAMRLFGNRTPYVCHIRFMPDRFPPRLLKFWLTLHFRYANKVLAVSSSVVRQLPGHPKLLLVYDELPTHEQHTPRADSVQNEFSFLYLANFINGKGQNFAVEAFGRIHFQLPNWRLRFVGSDMGLEKNREFKAALIKRTKELGIFHKTEWLDFVDDVEAEYKRSDVVLNFSESESFSITCLEALFFGKALIATDCGGPAEIIDHNETGILVPNRSVDAMADEMLKLAVNPEGRISLGSEARVRVRKKFSKENTSDLLASVYRSAINSH